MSSVIDEKGRVTIPRYITEELGLAKGDRIAFEKREQIFILRKVEAHEKGLEEIMSWNPKRTGKPEPVSPQEMKGIWKI